jgi:hypothetical protein
VVVSLQSSRNPKKGAKGFKDISHYFLSAAEADVSQDATGTADHLEDSTARTTPNKEETKPRNSSKPARRKDNCASCAHLIARAGRPFQCRIYSVEHESHGVERRERIDIAEGHTCPHFMRVTSKQIEDILRAHGSSLRPDQVREYARSVDEHVIHTKTITISGRAGASAEEALREELLRYLVDGYSIAEATVTCREESSEKDRSKTTIHKVILRLEEKG